MHDPLLHEIPEVGSSVIWFFKFCMIIAGVFIMFIAPCGQCCVRVVPISWRSGI